MENWLILTLAVFLVAYGVLIILVIRWRQEARRLEKTVAQLKLDPLQRSMTAPSFATEQDKVFPSSEIARYQRLSE